MIPQRTPDLTCCTLKLWIISREYPECPDYWDGNWMNAVAHCGGSGASVTVSGPILRLDEIKVFLEELEEMNRTLEGKAELPTLEPNLGLTLEFDDTGHIQGRCTITPDQISQYHRFEFGMDQSYLNGYILECKKILSKFPIKDPQQRL